MLPFNLIKSMASKKIGAAKNSLYMSNNNIVMDDYSKQCLLCVLVTQGVQSA
jgi:hypothetical protein